MSNWNAFSINYLYTCYILREVYPIMACEVCRIVRALSLFILLRNERFQ